MDHTFRCCLRQFGMITLILLSSLFLPACSSSMELLSFTSRTSGPVGMVLLSLLLLGLMRSWLRRRRSLLRVVGVLPALALALALGVLRPLPSQWSSQVGLLNSRAK